MHSKTPQMAERAFPLAGLFLLTGFRIVICFAMMLLFAVICSLTNLIFLAFVLGTLAFVSGFFGFCLTVQYLFP